LRLDERTVVRVQLFVVQSFGSPVGPSPGSSPLDPRLEPEPDAVLGAIDMSATIAVPSTGRSTATRRPARPPVSESTYRRRRAVVGTTLAVIVAVGTVLAHDVLAGSGGVPASAAESLPAPGPRTVTALPGDTLWSIAETHHGAVVLTRYVDELVRLNGGASIQAGQAVRLP
jgi:LysM repeat protein